MHFYSAIKIFVGAGGHAVSCADVALAMGYQKFYFVDPLKAGQQLLGFPVIASVANVFTSHTAIFVAVGDNVARQRVSEEIGEQFRERIR